MNPCWTSAGDHILQRAKKISLLLMDVDGVLTDGGLYYSEDGNESKRFHTLDGHGIKRQSQIVARRAHELGIQHLFQAQLNKLDCMNKLRIKLNLEANEIAYIGDDLPDLAVMKAVGLGIAVRNAHPLITRHGAHLQTTFQGGEGAVREVCDLILHAKGILEACAEID